MKQVNINQEVYETLLRDIRLRQKAYASWVEYCPTPESKREMKKKAADTAKVYAHLKKEFCPSTATVTIAVTTLVAAVIALMCWAGVVALIIAARLGFVFPTPIVITGVVGITATVYAVVKWRHTRASQ